MKTTIYGYEIEAKIYLSNNIVRIETPKHVISIVATPRNPKLFIDGVKKPIADIKGKPLGKNAKIWRFIDKIESPERGINILYENIGPGCANIWVYKYRGRIYITAGCYDDYYIFELRKGKLTVYRREFASFAGIDRVTKVKEYSIKDEGLFRPPKHKWLAEIITFESPSKAQEAANKLLRGLELKKIDSLKIGEKRALIIARALQYAANRAKASAKRRNLPPKERKELLKIARIYERAADKAWRIYKTKY